MHLVLLIKGSTPYNSFKQQGSQHSFLVASKFTQEESLILLDSLGVQIMYENSESYSLLSLSLILMKCPSLSKGSEELKKETFPVPLTCMSFQQLAYKAAPAPHYSFAWKAGNE